MKFIFKRKQQQNNTNMMHEMIIIWHILFNIIFNFKINRAITYGPLAIIYNYKTFSQK